MRKFISGNEALAHGVRLARPHVISAYPITPQTTVVEHLSSMCLKGSLKAEFVHVESEHSALSCAIGAAATGARTFTATSSQGLLYMAECLHYAAGGRFPVVMMNANRSTALPWNIYGDQRDSLGLLDQGWIQLYAENAQESLDMALVAYRVAEDPRVMTPVMINMDGFLLTHTYEVVDIPEQEQADRYLPPYVTSNRFDFDKPKSLAFSVGPEQNYRFKFREHQAMLRAKEVIAEAERSFAGIFGRTYTHLVENYRCDDAEYVIVTLGSVAGLVRSVTDELRSEGFAAGMLRIRYMRPFPEKEVAEALKGVKGAAVLEKDISFGYEGTVFTNVNSALQGQGVNVKTCNVIGGLGGADISREQIREIFYSLKKGVERRVTFIGISGDEYDD